MLSFFGSTRHELRQVCSLYMESIHFLVRTRTPSVVKVAPKLKRTSNEWLKVFNQFICRNIILSLLLDIFQAISSQLIFPARFSELHSCPFFESERNEATSAIKMGLQNAKTRSQGFYVPITFSRLNQFLHDVSRDLGLALLVHL